MAGKSVEPSSSRTLRERLARTGLRAVSASQIERWHKAGLLPPPRRRSLGRGRGTVSSYPPEAVGQVRALLRLLERHRNLDKVAVLLKLNGYVVSARACRRAVEHLVLNPFGDLDPYRSRGFSSPQVVAAGAAEQALKKRARTEEDRLARDRDAARAGGRSELLRLSSSVLLPLFGGLNRSTLLEAMDRFGIGDVARKLGEGMPGVGEAVAQEAEAGHMDVEWIREEALPRLSVEDFNTLVRAGRALLAALEALCVNVAPSDPFTADCVAALRRPEQRLPPPPPSHSTTGELEAEETALAFFAGGVAPNRRGAGSARAGGDS